jgi:hypothetical protein
MDAVQRNEIRGLALCICAIAEPAEQEWDYVPNENIPSVDASDIRAMNYVRGHRPRAH